MMKRVRDLCCPQDKAYIFKSFDNVDRFSDMKKFKVLITAPIHNVYIDILKEYVDVHVVNKLLSEEDIVNLVKELDPVAIVAVRGGDPITRKVFENSSRLLIVARHGVGYDRVDVEAATEHGVWVTVTPVKELFLAVAEHAIALIMCLARRICLADEATRKGVWSREEFEGLLLENKVLGIIGLGRIGMEIARKAKGLGMKIVYFDKIRKKDVEETLGVEYLDLHSLLKVSDFVVIAVPLTKETLGMIREEELKSMKRSAYIINIARGGIINHEALVKALEERWIAGAALDVFPIEPLPQNDPIIKTRNTVLTPHIAWFTKESRIAMARTVVEEVLRVLKCEDPFYPVNPEVRDKAKSKCKKLVTE